MSKITEEKKSDEEREVWEFMTPMAWHNSIAAKDSIFRDTYEATRQQVEETALRGDFDVIIEVGCGTGDVIGGMNNTKLPRFGLDINEEFIGFCREQYSGNVEFHVADALLLVDWWKSKGLDKRFHKPLVTCVNNTLNIMPEHLRGGLVEQLLSLAGPTGLCVVSYWNGNFFSHAIMNYYKKNEQLCGQFDIHQHVDWQNRVMVAPSNYSTEWHHPAEVQKLLRAYDVDVPNVEDCCNYGKTPHMNCEGLAIFVWFDQTCTSRAKGYYDSDDAQTFYHNIWGEDNIHVGRYDLLTVQDLQKTKIEQVAKAQELHELQFVQLVRQKIDNADGLLRIVDFGCGYGGLLRRLFQEGLVWSAVGCDISSRMCAQARRLNAKLSAEADASIQILEESCLDISMADESVDLVISMDALLHVGPDRQRRAIQEAARILRPGGWMLFSDIMQEENVNPEEMQPIYDRINLSKMGTISNYKNALTECGFSNVETDLFSHNISEHYSSILEVLQEKGQAIGLSPEYQTKAESGLQMWKTLAPNNIVWGFLAAQKTRNVDLTKLYKSN
jgi:sarcosine/dimethylglycine N-methyltransferase